MSPYEHHKIGRRAGVVSLFTFLSRILGVIRDAVVAYFLGATAMADAFYVAFRIPNLLRRLTAEGALTIAFVPVFTEYLKKSREEGKKVAGIVFTYLSIFLAVLVVLGVLFAPYMVKLIAYGFTGEPEKFTLAVYLTRIMFPYIFLISLTALAMGILNSLKHFASPAASPVLLNVFIIAGAAVFSKWFDEPTVGLAVGVLVGGFAQLSLQIPMLVKLKMLPGINFDYTHPGLKKLLLLMLPAAFGAAVYQVNVLIITLLASFLPDGSVAYLWYADRLAEFPLGIFAIAIATATLPTLSDHAADKDLDSFKKTFRFSLRSNFAIVIPSAFGLFVLAVPIIRMLFQRGAFTTADTFATAGTFAFFLMGLPFLSGVRNIVPAFFAMKDSKTPVAIATVVVVCNTVLAYLLMKPLLYRGLALAVAIADMINFTLLVVFLRRKIGRLGIGEMINSVAKIVISSAIMGAIVWVFSRYVVHSLLDGGVFSVVLAVVLSILAGIVVYLICLKITRAPELDTLLAVIRKSSRS